MIKLLTCYRAVAVLDVGLLGGSVLPARVAAALAVHIRTPRQCSTVSHSAYPTPVNHEGTRNPSPADAPSARSSLPVLPILDQT